MLPYSVDIVFNKKKFDVKLHIRKSNDSGFCCDYEILTNERMSGDEFQKLRAYLENEGYVEAAIEKFEKFAC